MNPETIKKHFAEHKEVYIGIGIGLTLAGITWVIVRGHKPGLAMQTGPGTSYADPVLSSTGDASPIMRGKSTDLVAGSVPDLVAGIGDSTGSVVDNTTRSFSFGFNNHTTSINNAVTTIHTGSAYLSDTHILQAP